MPSKSQLITVALAIGTLRAIHNVGALEPVKKFLNFDQ